MGEAGRRGEQVRSDCWVSVERRDSGGVDVELTSRVEVMYGRSIREQTAQVLNALGVAHAKVVIEDAGALPYVLEARIEAAVKREDPTVTAEYLPEMAEWSCYGSHRERFRRSRLYMPGVEPKFFINAGLHGADGYIFDLEDSVAPAEKDAGRILVRNALRQVNLQGGERMVRINQLPLGLKDIEAVAPHNVHCALVPKCESAEQVQAVADAFARAGAPNIFLTPIVESALGAIRAFEIATASTNVVALAIGIEDYTADIGAERTLEGRESFWARSQVINAARAAGVQALDTVFSDVSDEDGLRASVREARALGFDGKGCIHPRQIRPIHEEFAPKLEEIERARRIVLAFEKAEAEGSGVVALGSKMIDPPVVKRALRTVRLATEMDLLAEDWKEAANG